MVRTSEQMQEAHEVTGEQVSDVMESLRDAGTRARRLAQRQLGNLRETASGYVDQGRQRAKQVSDTIEHRIVETPFTSILVAAGVGFLFGILWNRR